MLQQQDRTIYLQDHENDLLFNHLSSQRSTSLSTTIVQLYLSEKPDHKRWTKQHTGILCFVKDSNYQSHYFRMFDLQFQLLWEQEMYTQFSYIRLTTNFHYFHADDCIAGFNFADEREADKFFKTVIFISKTEACGNRNSSGINQNFVFDLNINRPGKTQQQAPPSQPKISSQVSASMINVEQNADKLIKNDKKSKLKHKKVSKIEISNPIHFRVEQHIGPTNMKNNKFEISLSEDTEVADEMKKILGELNMPINKKTKQFVTAFINEHGGVEEFKKEIKSQKEVTSKQKQQAPPPPPPAASKKLQNQATVEGSEYESISEYDLNSYYSKKNQPIGTPAPPPPPPPQKNTPSLSKPNLSSLPTVSASPFSAPNYASTPLQEYHTIAEPPPPPPPPPKLPVKPSNNFETSALPPPPPPSLLSGLRSSLHAIANNDDSSQNFPSPPQWILGPEASTNYYDEFDEDDDSDWD